MPDSCIDAGEWMDPCTTISSKVVTARKEHRCCECGEAIQPGRKYERDVVAFDGDFSTYKTCARCANIRRDYFRSWVYGECVEAFHETHGFDYRDGLPPDFAPCQKGAPDDQRG